MKYLARLLAILLLTSAVYGQTVSIIKGIKIKESTFDPKTKIAKLTFINDSAADITGWAYCVHVTQIPGDYPSHGTCLMTDTSGPVVNYRINRKLFPKAPEPDCGGCRPIHPGQDYTFEGNLGSFPEVTNANIEVVMAVFSDGTWSANEQGKSWLRGFAEGRKDFLLITQQIIEMGNKVLADPNEKNPVVTMLAQMKQRAHLAGTSAFSTKLPEGLTYTDEYGRRSTEAPLDDETVELMRPDWRKGDNREYIPENQRGYLEAFLQKQQAWVDYLSKNQVAGLEATR